MFGVDTCGSYCHKEGHKDYKTTNIQKVFVVLLFWRWWCKVDIRYNRHSQLDNMSSWIRRQEELITKAQEQVFEVSDVVVGYYFLWSIFGNKAATR